MSKAVITKLGKSLRNGISPNWNVPEVLTAFVDGGLGKEVYQLIKDENLGSVWYDKKSGLVKGSNLPISARIDTLVREATQDRVRVANLRDLSRPEVMEGVVGNHYSDAPALVLRSQTDSYVPNQELIQRLLPKIEEVRGNTEFSNPLLITGFDVRPSDIQYGWEIAPRGDFAIFEDDRLSGKYDGTRFNKVDEFGIPIFDNEGERTFYARDGGLSGVCLSRDGVVDSDYDDLSNSVDDGRVVLVSAGTADAKSFEAQLRQEYESKMDELNERFDRAVEVLRGKK
jgi:hypothetical protein